MLAYAMQVLTLGSLYLFFLLCHRRESTFGVGQSLGLPDHERHMSTYVNTSSYVTAYVNTYVRAQEHLAFVGGGAGIGLDIPNVSHV